MAVALQRKPTPKPTVKSIVRVEPPLRLSLIARVLPAQGVAVAHLPASLRAPWGAALARTRRI
jgi:hypothetical protein